MWEGNGAIERAGTSSRLSTPIRAVLVSAEQVDDRYIAALLANNLLVWYLD